VFKTLCCEECPDSQKLTCVTSDRPRKCSRLRVDGLTGATASPREESFEDGVIADSVSCFRFLVGMSDGTSDSCGLEGLPRPDSAAFTFLTGVAGTKSMSLRNILNSATLGFGKKVPSSSKDELGESSGEVTGEARVAGDLGVAIGAAS